MSKQVLQVKNLSVDIPLAGGVLHAVDNVSLSVTKGETLCIVGEFAVENLSYFISDYGSAA